MDVEEYREIGRFVITIGDCRYSAPRHCPHRAGQLKYGFINRKRRTIACPLHRSIFSLETGEQLAGPECGRLDVKKLSNRIGNVSREGDSRPEAKVDKKG